MTACLVRPDMIVSGFADRTIRLSGRAKGRGAVPRIRRAHRRSDLAFWSDVYGRTRVHGRGWHHSNVGCGLRGVANALRGHESAVLHCISPAHLSLVSCSRDHTLRCRLCRTARTGAPDRPQSRGARVRRAARRRLLSWSADRTLRLWNMDDGRPLDVLEGHTGPVNSASVINDGQVVSCSDDRELLRWQVGQWTHRWNDGASRGRSSAWGVRGRGVVIAPSARRQSGDYALGRSRHTNLASGEATFLSDASETGIVGVAPVARTAFWRGPVANVQWGGRVATGSLRSLDRGETAIQAAALLRGDDPSSQSLRRGSDGNDSAFVSDQPVADFASTGPRRCGCVTRQ